MKNRLLLLLLLITSSVCAQDWIRYENKVYNFSINLPEEPTNSSQEVPTQVGELTMDMFMVDASENENSNNLLYMIIYTKYPMNLNELEKSEVQNMLDGSVDGAVANVKGKLVYANKIQLDGYPGREAKIELQGAFIYVNMYVKDGAMYATQTICLTENDENEDIKKFLNSFKLNKEE